MRTKEPIAPRQFGPAAVAVDEYLRSLGCENVTFIKNKHIKVSAMVGPKHISFSLPCTPRDDTDAAKQAVRQAKRRITAACIATA